MTPKQKAMLQSIAAQGGARYVRGAGEVFLARALVALGFATLCDDGIGLLDHGRVDGERWTVAITDAGRTALPETVICGKCEHEWPGPAVGKCPACGCDTTDPGPNVIDCVPEHVVKTNTC